VACPFRPGTRKWVLGELFRETGWKRDEVVVANKLWWEFWPEQTAAEELDGSLGRMRFDHVDLIYAERPPDGLRVEEVVTSVARLIDSGKAHTWGVLNGQPEQIAAAVRFSASEGLPAPCAAQLPYSLVYPEFVEDEAMTEALDLAGTSVVASAVLAGGALTGKYARADANPNGRLAGEPPSSRRRKAFEVGERLLGLADEMRTTPSRLAIAFAMANPRVCSVLFGATSPEQVAENVGALEVFSRMDEASLGRIRSIQSAVAD
jgi:L-glyceraldehyde 3-phosphate reductase